VEDMSASVMLVYGGCVDCVVIVVLLGYRKEDAFNNLIVILFFFVPSFFLYCYAIYYHIEKRRCFQPSFFIVVLLGLYGYCLIKKIRWFQLEWMRSEIRGDERSMIEE
jgi:hypothetical protein